MKVILPLLKPEPRDREYYTYPENLRDRVIYEYLFYSRSHRWLDHNILNLDSRDSRGYQAMGILHHIGLRNGHKGIFHGLSVTSVRDYLRESDALGYDTVLDCLERIR